MLLHPPCRHAMCLQRLFPCAIPPVREQHLDCCREKLPPRLQAAQIAQGAVLLQVPCTYTWSSCLNAIEGVHEQLSAHMLALSHFTPCCSEELPPPPRRDRLPKPQQVEKSVGLWSIIKECVGKDLTRVCLPVFFNEPLSALQKSAEDLEYAELLDKVRSPAVKKHLGGELVRDWWTDMGRRRLGNAELSEHAVVGHMVGAGKYLVTIQSFQKALTNVGQAAGRHCSPYGTCHEAGAGGAGLTSICHLLDACDLGRLHAPVSPAQHLCAEQLPRLC